MRASPVLALALVTSVTATELGAQARRIELSDLGRIVRVSDAQLSPDGRSELVLVVRPDYNEDRYRTDLVAVPASGGEPHVIISDRRGHSSPRWSPAGDRIAFLASEGASTPAQLWIAATAGGEPTRITNAGGGVQHFAWRPSGSSLACVGADSAPQRTGAERFNDSFEVGSNDYLITAAPMASHPWLYRAPVGGRSD